MSDNNENRIEGIWPTVRVHRKNTENRTQRKVLQTRTAKIPAGDLIRRIETELRAGAAVELLDGKGKGAIRVYACVTKDFKSMYATSATMGDFRQSLNDIRFRVVRGVIGKNESMESAEDWAEIAEGMKNEAPSVVPDQMVTCPKCGTRFRVGRRNAVAAA